LCLHTEKLRPKVAVKRTHTGATRVDQPQRVQLVNPRAFTAQTVPTVRTTYHKPIVVVHTPNDKDTTAAAPTDPTPAVTSTPALGNDQGAKAMATRVYGASVQQVTPADNVPEPEPFVEEVFEKNDTDTVDVDEYICAKPAQSWMVRNPIVEFNLNSQKGKDAMMATLPTPVQVQLQQPFGKDDLEHSFTNSATFRHALLPLYFSNYLDDEEWNNLCSSVPSAHRLGRLLQEHGTVDFRPLRENFFKEGWEDETDFDYQRCAMLSSCLLFYKGSVAAVVRYVGGPLVGAHRDVPKLLSNIRDVVPSQIYKDVERVFVHGAPAQCNASSTDENLDEFLAYGNHSTADQDEALMHKTMLKDEKRGHAICFDERLSEFVQHMHLCPVGLCDLDHPIKKPRFIYDASFHPKLTSETINDWTNKENEPPLEFPATFQKFITWIWNMRISHPDEEIYPLDDDITAAFRTLSWHPNLVSMHGLMVLGLLWFMVRLTFGDCTSPPNFEPIAIARRYMAQFYYNLPNVIELAAKYMPKLTIVEPSVADLQSIMRIPPDSHNPGVVSFNNKDADTPPYVHHVDDNLYGALRSNIYRAIAASILALYAVVGEPVADQPDPFSYEKFDLICNHRRKITGVIIDTRTMFLWLPDYKRKEIVDLLAHWLTIKEFTIIEGLELQGVLMNAARFNNWGRIRFFILQGVISNVLRQRYQIAMRYKEKAAKGVQAEVEEYNLPASVEKRLIRQGCNEVYAKHLYSNHIKTGVSKRLHSELRSLHAYLADPVNPWQISIGHMIPREHVSKNTGDSSFYGVGFWTDELKAICMLPTCNEIRKRCRLGKANPALLTMNILEFVTAVLDFACSITMLEHESCAEMCKELFPNGVPPMARIISMKDNRTAESWIRKGAAGSLQGQQLIRISGEMGVASAIKQDGGRIPGDKNDEADKLSRPDKENGYRMDRDSLVAHFDSTLVKYPRFVDYRVFMPSDNLLEAIAWALRPTDQVAKTDINPPQLVQPYGRFISTEEFRVSMTFLYDTTATK